ncbi:MAG: ABC transporter permease, partial [Ezakiella coagulans]|uniref:ABC transporter permease n=1 Tax=Ezakiella coagulans TaxID=46507 RepID=UPI00399A57D9
SLKNGMNSLADRMGADISVVPEGYDTKVEGAILRGEPNTFFMDKSIVKKIEGIDGVQEVTPQLFLATLSAGCCSFPIQIIGFDAATDFVVTPWLQEQISLPLENGEVVVGNNVVGDVNSHVKFFDQEFKIKGRLQKTGMGFDNTVFLNFDEARRLAKEYEKILEIEDKYDDNMISSVMLKIKKGVEPTDVQNAIRRECLNDGVFPLLSKSMMNEVSNSALDMINYVYILIALVWILTFIVLSLVYSITIKERKRELATMRILGATKKILSNIILYEVLIINFIGAISGATLGFVISILFGRWFSQSFKMPFLAPNFVVLAVIFLAVLVIATLMGPISTLSSLKK